MIMTLTKEKLAERIANKNKMTKADAKKALETAMEEIKRSVSKGTPVALRGFGTFKRIKRAEKTARDINRKRFLKVPGHYVPKFKPGKNFRETVDPDRYYGDKQPH